MVEHKTRAANAALALVHHHPHFRLHSIGLGEHRHEIRIFPCDEIRVSPNPEGGATHCDLRHRAIGSQRICFARDWTGSIAKHPNIDGFGVEANESVLSQLSERARHAVARDVVAMRIESKTDLADFAREEAWAGGTSRIAISASRSRRFSVALVRTSSMAMAGCWARKLVKIGGINSVPTNSGTVTRTVPRASSELPDAVRTKASAEAAIA